MLRLIAVAVALVLAAVAPVPDGRDSGYPGPTATAVSAPPPAEKGGVYECAYTIDAPGGGEICAAWTVWGAPPLPTPAAWPQAYP